MRRFLIVHPDDYIEFIYETEDYISLQVDNDHTLAKLGDTGNGFVFDLGTREIELDYAEAGYLLELLLGNGMSHGIKRYTLIPR